MHLGFFITTINAWYHKLHKPPKQQKSLVSLSLLTIFLKIWKKSFFLYKRIPTLPEKSFFFLSNFSHFNFEEQNNHFNCFCDILFVFKTCTKEVPQINPYHSLFLKYVKLKKKKKKNQQTEPKKFSAERETQTFF